MTGGASDGVTGGVIGVRCEDGEPKVGPHTVAGIVHACHERTIDDGLAALAVPGLTRATLEPVLIYCAEMRCEPAGVTCGGCKRRTEARGITSLDQFVAAHREVVIAETGLRLAGGGEGRASSPSLETLARDWAGVAYWYWARRVIRKLRHGIRRAEMQGSPFHATGESPAIILMEPQLADNIGMVARACANFGLDEMRLINPRDGWPNEKARVAASGANYIIDDAVAVPSLEAAITDLTWLAATTARQRDLRKPVMTPAAAIAEIRRRIGEGERVGLLFGRERNGLETDEVANADALIMIPVNSRFASLNLAQAVLLLGYEWMRTDPRQSLGRVTTYERPVAEGLNLGDDRPATKEELYGLFGHLETALDETGFFNPPHRRPSVVRNVRTMLTRMALTAQEVRTLRGIVATLTRPRGNERNSST